MDRSGDDHIMYQSFLLMAWAHEHIAILKPSPFPLAHGKIFLAWYRWASPANSFGYDIKSWRRRLDFLLDDDIFGGHTLDMSGMRMIKSWYGFDDLVRFKHVVPL